MKQYLLDTNICAFMFRGKYGVRKRLQQIGLQNCHISILSNDKKITWYIFVSFL